jgi:hypothetical protein
VSTSTAENAMMKVKFASLNLEIPGAPTHALSEQGALKLKLGAKILSSFACSRATPNRKIVAIA